MDNSFISKSNIDNIYEYINVYFVKNHNFNLDSYDKYKKITKKLAKTIFNSVKDNNTYKNILVNDFNELVLNNSIDFLKKDIETKKQHTINVKSANSGLIESTLLDNSVKKHKSKKKVKFNQPKEKNDLNEIKNSNNESNNTNDDFVNNLDTFNKQIKEANKKIKDNFNKIISGSNNNFDKDKNFDKNNSDNSNTLSINSNKLAFEKILEDKLEENNLPELTNSTESVYNTTSINDILTSVIFKQNDNSKSNQLESYEGETYLPNLITPVGEEAPIQPLIYQNTRAGSERIDKKVITIDSGTIGASPSYELSLDTVTNNGTNSNSWYKYRVDLQDTISIDKLCDVYLRNLTLVGIAKNTVCQYIVIDIDEFNIRNFSNNQDMRNKIIATNTITAEGIDSVLNVNYGSEDNYITTINPSKIAFLNITITNQDGANSDTNTTATDGKTFYTSTGTTNRVIFELEFRGRAERDDMIYEKQIYSGSK